MRDKKLLTIPELAKILGISRIAVYKKVKSGEIKAGKVGRIYAIPQEEFDSILGKTLTTSQKRVINQGVAKTVKEYGEVLQLLGRD